jgi:hypothetical protein
LFLEETLAYKKFVLVVEEGWVLEVLIEIFSLRKGEEEEVRNDSKLFL